LGVGRLVGGRLIVGRVVGFIVLGNLSLGKLSAGDLSAGDLPLYQTNTYVYLPSRRRVLNTYANAYVCIITK
jgi:hypothetical protein